MKKLIPIGAILISAAMSAQTPLSDFTSSLEGKLVSFDYSFKVKGDVPVMGEGTVAFKNSSFSMKGNGLEVFSDGKIRWTVDTSDKEVYIEEVNPDDANYVSNPAMLLANVEEAFSVKSEKAATVFGKSAKALTLEPAIKGTGLSTAVLYLSGNTPIGIDITIKDGTVTTFKLGNYKLSDDDADFSFDVSTLDNSYSITDLR